MLGIIAVLLAVPFKMPVALNIRTFQGTFGTIPFIQAKIPQIAILQASLGFESLCSTWRVWDSKKEPVKNPVNQTTAAATSTVTDVREVSLEWPAGLPTQGRIPARAGWA